MALAEQFAGNDPERVLTLVAEKVDNLDKRFDALDVKMDEWHKDEIKRCEIMKEKLWTHDMALEAHKSDITAISKRVEDIESNVCVLSSMKNTKSKQPGVIRRNKDKIIITLITVGCGLIVYLITDNPDAFTWILP